MLGRELLLHLAGHLCTAHQAGDADITALVANTRIHLIPRYCVALICSLSVLW